MKDDILFVLIIRTKLTGLFGARLPNEAQMTLPLDVI